MCRLGRQPSAVLGSSVAVCQALQVSLKAVEDCSENDVLKRSVLSLEHKKPDDEW